MAKNRTRGEVYRTQKYRKETLKEQGTKCELCHRIETKVENLTVHHMLPAGKGGETKADNLMLLCKRCHNWFHTSDRNQVEYVFLIIEKSLAERGYNYREKNPKSYDGKRQYSKGEILGSRNDTE